MISKHGRMKMYCKDDLSKIENYHEAVNDKENIWHLHHRLELTINGEFAHFKEDLIRLNMYYHRPAFELIFLREDEHHKLHGQFHKMTNDGIQAIKDKNTGRKRTEEQKKLISDRTREAMKNSVKFRKWHYEKLLQKRDRLQKELEAVTLLQKRDRLQKELETVTEILREYDARFAGK